MPKISVKLGITMPGPEEFSSLRADFSIADIDPDEDVEEQLKKALEVGDDITASAEAGLAQQISNLSGMTVNGVGVGQAFADFREKFGPAWKTMVSRVDALEGTEPKKTTPKKKTRKTKK